MADYAHKVTDAILKEMEKELKRYYQSSLEEITKKMSEILNKMNLGKDLTPAQLLAEANKYDRLQLLEKQLTESLKNANSEAVKIINGQQVNVYQTNFNWQTKQLNQVVPLIDKNTVKSILTKEVNPFKQLTIDNLKDSAMIRNKLTNQLVNGIIQGDSMKNIAKRIRSVYESNLSDSVRIARTEVTRVEASARQQVGKDMEALGFKVYKRWVATEDERTRPEHAKANGQEVPLNEPFIVGGEKLMYPGDESGSAWNVINCRCTMVTISKLDKRN